MLGVWVDLYSLSGGIIEKILKIGVDMDDKFDILDVLFVVETLIAGYFIWYLWDKI